MTYEMQYGYHFDMPSAGTFELLHKDMDQAAVLAEEITPFSITTFLLFGVWVFLGVGVCSFQLDQFPYLVHGPASHTSTTARAAQHRTKNCLF